MCEYASKIIELVEALPKEEQHLVYEIVKRFTLAWDPDFTKLSDTEANKLCDAHNGSYQPL